MGWKSMFAAGITALSVLLGSPAWAAPTQASRAEVLQQLSITREPSDYVVLVDVSGSMSIDNRYDRVRSALDGMMSTLSGPDTVALITFSDAAEVAYQGTDKQAALAALPARPTGAKTDIGAGIEAGLNYLQRPGATASGVLALITDGTIDALPDSPYAAADAPGWATLTQEARALSEKQSVAAYAIALGNETDAGLLGKVFPEARNVPGDQIGPYLGRIDAELLNFKAAEQLRGDATAAVSATWSNLDPESLVATGRANPTLTLTSTLTKAPVEVTGLAVVLGDGEAGASGLPEVVALEPGESQQFPITLTVGRLGPGGGSLVTRGTVESPWRAAASEFGVTLNPRLDTAPVHLTPTATTADEPATQTQNTSLLPALGGAAALLVVLLALLAVRSRRAELRGAFQITREGVTVREFMLSGARIDLARTAGPQASGLVGSISPQRKDGTEGVRVVARVGKQKVTTVLRDGEQVTVGGLTLRWTSQRTRTLDMVNEGLDGA